MPKRYCIAHIVLTFDIQYTFGDGEIQPDPEGDENDYEPTISALTELEQELGDYLRERYSVGELSAIDCETLDSQYEDI